MRNWHRSELTGLLALSLALAVGVTAVAQTSTTNPQSRPALPSRASSPEDAQQQNQARGQATSVNDELGLTLDQKQKIAAVMEDQDRQLSAVRDDASLSPDQKREKAAQIREVGSSKIRAMLTPEQLQKLASIQERVKQQQPDDQNAPKEPLH